MSVVFGETMPDLPLEGFIFFYFVSSDCSVSEGTEEVGGVCWPLPSPSAYIVSIIIRIQCVLVQYITVVIGMLCTAFHIDVKLNGGKIQQVSDM